MIHCAGGSGRTGMVVAAVVKVCYWDKLFSCTNRAKIDAFNLIAQSPIKSSSILKAYLIPKKLYSESCTTKKAHAAIIKSIQMK